jgi:hypothetical protein
MTARRAEEKVPTSITKEHSIEQDCIAHDWGERTRRLMPIWRLYSEEEERDSRTVKALRPHPNTFLFLALVRI